MIDRIPLASLVFSAALAAVAGLAFVGTFSLDELVVPVVAASAGSVAIAGLLRAVGAPVSLAGLASLAGLSALLVVVGVQAGVAPAEVPGATAEGLTQGWQDLLAAVTPVPARFELLAVPIVVTWVAGAATAELVARTRARLATVAPAVAAGAVALLVAPVDDRPSLLATGAFVAAAAGLVSSRSTVPVERDGGVVAPATTDPAQRAARRRQRLVAAVPVVALVALAAPLLAVALPLTDDEPYTLRGDVEVPLEPEPRVSPLALVGSGDPDERVAEVTLDAVPAGGVRLAVVALDRYDGQQWTTDAGYLEAGEDLSGLGLDVGGIEVRQQVRLERLPAGPWLPTMERPVRVEIDREAGTQVAPDSVNVAVTDPPPGPVAYDVVSRVPEPDPTELPTAGVATAPAARAAVATADELPPDLAALRDEVVGPAVTPFQQLARLLAFFTNDPRVNTGTAFAVDPAVGAGWSVGHLRRLLDPEGPRTGTEAQYAVAFATLARSLGFPTRVVVGYAPEGVVAGEAFELMASDLVAWPEVALAGQGWVPFEPSPSEESDLDVPVEQEQLQVSVDDAVDQSLGAGEPPPPQNPNLADPEVATSTGRTWFRIGVLAIGVACLLGLLLAPVAAKRRRRAARRRGEPAERVAGAYREAVDRLTELGAERTASLTPQEAAALAEQRYGDDAGGALVRLGSRASAAVHRAEPPGNAEATAAWEDLGSFSSAVRSRLGWRERLRAALSRRSLSR